MFPAFTAFIYQFSCFLLIDAWRQGSSLMSHAMMLLQSSMSRYSSPRLSRILLRYFLSTALFNEELCQCRVTWCCCYCTKKRNLLCQMSRAYVIQTQSEKGNTLLCQRYSLQILCTQKKRKVYSTASLFLFVRTNCVLLIDHGSHHTYSDIKSHHRHQHFSLYRLRLIPFSARYLRNS